MGTYEHKQTEIKENTRSKETGEVSFHEWQFPYCDSVYFVFIENGNRRISILDPALYLFIFIVLLTPNLLVFSAVVYCLYPCYTIYTDTTLSAS